MKPEIWGAPLWQVLFDLAHWHKGSASQDLQRFFQLLEHVLPCVDCRAHCRNFSHYCSSLPNCTLDYGLYLLYPLKNAVNRRLAKNEISVKVYLQRRKLFPITGNAQTFHSLRELLSTYELGTDSTLRVTQVNQWFELGMRLSAPIPGYGVLIECPIVPLPDGPVPTVRLPDGPVPLPSEL